MRLLLAIVLSLLIASNAAQKDAAIVHCDDTRPLLQIGSSTVFPLSQAHSVSYANPYVVPQVFSTGSSLGFENFLAWGSDIATSSRKLRGKDYQLVDCFADDVNADGVALRECQGRLPVGVRVGIDLISIIVHPQASWIPKNGITMELLGEIFDTQNTKLWFDLVVGGPREPPFFEDS
eukprot:TRINITY_DN40487_c0_g1_i1.p2 TRINITY_DN40487_c0_g1~~TRINITY_DN40487_c0_g1_i1.p2  ORF type:complete len:178 (+),score=30.68 TRINITY_DN40487_c0_g1_i1:127-660(+)